MVRPIQARAPELTLMSALKHAWQRLPHRFMIKNVIQRGVNQHGSKVEISSFFRRPSMKLRRQFLHERAAFCLGQCTDYSSYSTVTRGATVSPTTILVLVNKPHPSEICNVRRAPPARVHGRAC